uniref:c-type cytochrome n=1 Tax=Pararhizobium sp. IMCC3301 TaxID=3067904 RepID=UPI00274203B5|nr:cytochrome c [Pararhizobium sp. IMCC3301]
MPVSCVIGRLLVAILFIGLQKPQSAGAQQADLRLIVPQRLIDTGLIRHLLPRFRFKSRIRVEAVPEGGEGEASLLPDAEGGVAVMSSAEGEPYYLAMLSGDPEHRKKISSLQAWLQSVPGRSAIESFKPDGTQMFTPGAKKIVKAQKVKIEGDADLGSKLALLHCGRCHVIDSRNPFGGIGSTPSFGAMRGMPKWATSFPAFWSINPHPAFTQIEGITEPFDPARPPPIAPLILTLEEVEAISSFVSRMKPKDLGGGVEAR